MIKKIKIFIILITLAFTNNLLAQDTVAFIDINFLFNNSSAGKKINEQIKDKSKKINSDVSSFRKKVNDDKEKLLAEEERYRLERGERRQRRWGEERGGQILWWGALAYPGIWEEGTIWLRS